MNISKITTLASIKNYQERIAEQESNQNADIVYENTMIKAHGNQLAAILENQANYNTKVSKYKDWSNSIRESLLADCIMSLFNESFNKIYSEDKDYDAIKQALVTNFIKEEGALNLVNKFKYASNFLAEYALLVEGFHKKLTEKVDKSCCDAYAIDPIIKDDFFTQLNLVNSEKVAAKIRERVTDAVEDFVIQNTENRIEIKDILQKAQENISKASNDQVKEAASINANRKISLIQSKPKNIFGEMVFNTCKNISTNPEIRPLYTNESGSLNMDKIVESCKVMYTFLEMLNTAKMVNFNDDKIKEVICSIGK